MSENDMVRRGDVLRIIQDEGEQLGCSDPGRRACYLASDMIRALPASPAFPPDAVERVAKACWDYDRECDWSEADAVEREAYYEEARAVLAALGGGA